MGERSEMLFRESRAATEKLDYFMAGLIAALTAYLVQNLKPAKVELTPQGLEVLSILLLILALLAAIRRIQVNEQIIRANFDLVQAQSSAASLGEALATGRGAPLMSSAGDFVDPESAGERYANEKTKEVQAMKTLMRLGNESMWRSRARDWLLALGFLCLLAARVWQAYV